MMIRVNKLIIRTVNLLAANVLDKSRWGWRGGGGKGAERTDGKKKKQERI